MQLVFQWSYEPSVSAVECFQQHQPAWCDCSNQTMHAPAWSVCILAFELAGNNHIISQQQIYELLYILSRRDQLTNLVP